MRIFAPKMSEVTGWLRKWHNEKLHSAIKSWSMRLEVLQGSWRSEMRTTFWLERLKVKDHSEDLDVDGRIY